MHLLVYNFSYYNVTYYKYYMRLQSIHVKYIYL